MEAVILAAGLGSRLSDITNGEFPKPLLEVGGKSLLERSLGLLASFKEISTIYIVVGHLREQFSKFDSTQDNVMVESKTKTPKIKLIYNENYAATSSMASFAKALPHASGDILLLEGDLIYERKCLELLLSPLAQKLGSCVLLSPDKQLGDDYFYEIAPLKIDEKTADDFKTEIDSTKVYHIISQIQKSYEDMADFGELVGISRLDAALCSKISEHFHALPKPLQNTTTYEGVIGSLGILGENIPCIREDLLYSEIDDRAQLEFVQSHLLDRLDARQNND